MDEIDRERLLDLVALWDEQCERGVVPTAEELCPDNPALQSALRDRIEQQIRIERMIAPSSNLENSRHSRTSARMEFPESGDGNSQNGPELIGRYRIERLLGSGGFGRVLLAYDDELTRYVAIKVPHKELLSRAEHVEAYRREARVVAGLDHPSIVPVYDVGRSDRHPCFLVSKYIPGINLSDRAKQSELSLVESIRIIATVADALHYSHSHGVVHRDIKPSNILLAITGEPFVVDFGLALLDTNPRDARQFTGTPAYMSPEQARKEAHRVDGRSDIFSLGIVLYELLCQRRPFRNDSLSELLQQIVAANPIPPRQINPEVPPALEWICQKAIAKRASDRYQTAKDLANDLRQLLVDPQSVSAKSGILHRGSAITNGIDQGSNVADHEQNPLSSLAVNRSDVTADRSTEAKIVPRGLRSFDEHDAFFFLRLLPGARGRDGIPDSVHFWKTRIEERDCNRTFFVGLIYGSSGCGKSSFVKAGLLPRLSSDVFCVYVECAPGTTESSILKGIRRKLTGFDNEQSLVEVLTAIRSGSAQRGNSKVLIVLDQFEQWLHARQSHSDGHGHRTELIEALRQCDGEHLQCLVLVRDEFWMAASAFARDLEVTFVEGQSMIAIEPFSIRHARQVLWEFGRALDCVASDAGADQENLERFIELAISELSESGTVAPLKISVFAEMTKDKPWVPETMKQVGGIHGIGTAYLESLFGEKCTNGRRRYHRQAAKAILKSLLPEQGIDIRGHVRSHDQILEASGCQSRLSDFDDVVQMLSHELRLVRLSNLNEEPIDENSLNGSITDKYGFQLSHDYLIPSLRDWLARKQKETRKGRAELLLADRAALWNARPENRMLPNLSEFLEICFFTKSKDRTALEQQMLRVATIRFVSRFSALLCLIAIVSFGLYWFRDQQDHERVATAVHAVLSTTASEVPDAVRNLDQLPTRIIQEELASTNPTGDSLKRLRIAYAKAELGEVDIDALIAHAETAPLDESTNIINALGHVKDQSLKTLDLEIARFQKSRNFMAEARMSLIALYLGNPAPASDMCRITGRGDATRRNCFIESFCFWHGDTLKLVDVASNTNDVELRSGVCLGLAGMLHDRVTESLRVAWKPVFQKWFQSAQDSCTHNSAGTAFLYWRLPFAVDESMRNPSESRDWALNSLGMTLVTIPPRYHFVTDGDHANENDLTRFQLADREIAIAQFAVFILDPKCPPEDKPAKAPEYFQSIPTFPVHHVTWIDAVKFCNWLSRREGLAPCYVRSTNAVDPDDEFELVTAANGYRLPTAAEWQIACQAGTTTPYSYGADFLQLRYANMSAVTLDHVAARFPNGWGLFDMHGNVAEWCGDVVWYSNPASGSRRSMRSVRGGDGYMSLGSSQSKSTWATTPNYHSPRIGFRVARSLNP